MDYKVIPISITSPSWEIFIKICQEELGFSPTRGLDEAGISLKSSAAFLSTLDLNNTPRTALAYDSRIRGHVSLGFIFIVDARGLINIYDYLRGMTISYRSCKDPDNRFVVVTGTVSSWYDALITSCSPAVPRAFRAAMNIVYNCLSAGGFKDIFCYYDYCELADGTFELVRN